MSSIKLSTPQIIAYSAGMAGWSVLINVMSVMLIYIYLPPENVGLNTLIPAVVYIVLVTDYRVLLDPKKVVNPNKVFSGPLKLSLRFNLLILLVAGIAVPIVLYLAGLLFPSIIGAYVPWIVPVTTLDFIFAFWLGMFIGYILVEIVNLIPVGFVLSIGGPFMRLFRKIWH